MLEVEKRVLLTNSNLFQATILDLATLNYKTKRFTMVNVSHSNFQPDPNRLIDLKVRTTGDTGTIVTKYGNWHSDASRQEYEIKFKTLDLGNLLNTLKLLGYKYYVSTYITRTLYTYNDFRLTFDQYHSMEATIFEIELNVENKDEVVEAEHRIDSFLLEHSLKPLNSKETIELISRMNSIPECQVNFDTLDVDHWLNTHHEFVWCQK